MEKRLIFAEGCNKYYKASLPTGISNYGNENFYKLLQFIGMHRPYGDKNEIGSAYIVIRQRTNQLLGLSWSNRVLRTSKREVVALRRYFNKGGKNSEELFVKIPFKVAYIFMAIAQIIEEIHSAGFDIPTSLKSLVNETYSKAFYKEYVNAYDNSKDDIPEDKAAQKALNNDFHGPFSPLNTVFK